MTDEPLRDPVSPSLTDDPPREPTEATKDVPPSRTIGSSRTSVAKIKERLNNEFMGFGMFVFTFNEADGKAIMEGSEQLADSLAAWAQDSPRIRKWLESGISGSHLVSVLGAFSAIAVPIMRNHNLIPDFGFIVPEPTDDGEGFARDIGTSAGP